MRLLRWFRKHNKVDNGISVIRVNTELEARKFVLDENGSHTRWDAQAEMWATYSEDLSGHRIVKDRVVTNAFVAFVVDQLQAESSEIGDFKFHQCGLGVTAENATDTGIETDTGISPVTGTQTEGATANIYKSVATMTMDATEAITEHVVMSQSGAGTCMDRTLFSAINVVSGNQIEFTFQITLTAGG